MGGSGVAMPSPGTPAISCWLCGSPLVQRIHEGLSPRELTPEHFAITDAHYGKVLSLYECKACAFRFCPEAGDVTPFYCALRDDEYERTREQRSLQARHLLAKIRPCKPSGTLLDIGAGSGILVEQAAKLGYSATGVEPGRWLVEQGRKHGITLLEGVFPDAVGGTCYDVITMIDVLEHVGAPLTLLEDAAAHLNAGGIAVIVTPDVESIAARLLGKKWWHYRVAHIGYFQKSTLKMALQKAGLEPVAWHRPAWFFPLDYLLLRLGHYMPFIAGLARLRVTKSITVPLNLYDSWLVVVRKAA